MNSPHPDAPTPDGGKPTTLLPERLRPGLFQAYGVEIETMIVDAETLAVKPVADALMEAVAGGPESEVDRGDLAWSNELVLHVLEVKTNGPAESLEGLATAFHASMMEANEVLAPMGARLLPGPVHPWMDPLTETVLWPHEYTQVYHTFDRIFSCSGHGWANLQSTHLNLPFGDDEEFGRLHAAIRLILPLIPALSAASPYLDGRRAGHLDARLAAYRSNARRVPSVTGRVVPEPAFTQAEYEERILGTIYRDLEPHDPEGVLRYEWVNARGAIARFDRGAVEIRVIDAQESPAADLAVVAAVTAAVRALTTGPLAERDPREDPSTDELAGVLDEVITRGDEARVRAPALIDVLGMSGEPTAGDVWRALLHRAPPTDLEDVSTRALEVILAEGPLARRLVARGGDEPSRDELRNVALSLCDALDRNGSVSDA